MGLAAFNRMRRLAAEQAKAAGTELGASDDQLQPLTAAQKLLAAINDATDAKELASLPSIGNASGKRIIENRPDGGYADLDAVKIANEDLAKPPYNVDWDKAAATFAEQA